MGENQELKIETYGNWKNKVKSKFEDVKDWCSEHKEVIIALAPCMIGGAVEMVKIAARKGNINEEKRLKENYIYDRSSGHYYELRRKPSNKEWIHIDHRKSLGDPLGEILNDLRLLK